MSPESETSEKSGAGLPTSSKRFSIRRAVGVRRESRVGDRDGERFVSPREQCERIRSTAERDGLEHVESIVAVVLAGRLQGPRSLVGLPRSLVVIVGFVVPAIQDGASPVGVALVGALAVMSITIPLSHGVGPKSLAAELAFS